jgi:hypothetical protein
MILPNAALARPHWDASSHCTVVAHQPDRIPHVTRETRYIILFAAGFIALGLWQHLYFSYSVGGFAFFKNGYDEDAYILFPFGLAGLRPDRLLTGAIVSTMLWFSDGSCNFALMALDALLPPLIFLAAYYVGAAVFARFPARCLFALVLVFSSDLLSLGSAASYPGPFPTIDQFRALVGDAFVPPMETSFLALYRSPEPQVSYVIGFLFTGLLLRLAIRDDEGTSRRDDAKLVIVQALMMMCYALVSYPLLLVEGCAAIILWLAGRPRKAVTLAILFSGSIVVALVSARITLGPSSTTMLLFSSHLPVITVGVILAFALTITLSIVCLRNGRSDPRLMIGLAFAAMPLALTNQQILTGVMASAREWERNVDLPFVVIAAGILISHTRWRPSWQNRAIALATIMVAGFAAVSSARTYDLWLPDNLNSLAIARAITAAKPSLDRDTLLVLDRPEYAPFVEARLGRPIHALLNYADVFKHPVAPTPEFKLTLLSDSLFEYWKQGGLTPGAAKEILEQEARQRSGYYSGFLFNICEYWQPCTDGRNVRTDKIVAALPTVIDSYAAFLAKPAPPLKFAFVTLKSPPDLSKGVKIGEGRAASVTAQVSLRN